MSVQEIVAAVKSVLPKNLGLYHHHAPLDVSLPSSEYFTQNRVKDFADYLRDLTGAQQVVPMSSGSAALHIALIVSGVKPGDLVIVPSMTFVATANAVIHAGAVPYFIDAGLFIRPFKLRQFLGHMTTRSSDHVGRMTNERDPRRVSAIIPVNILGHPGPIDQLTEVANEFGLVVIEDAAAALGSIYKGKACGTWGTTGIMSFNYNKIVTTGGGGALLTDDEWVAAKAHQLSTTARINHPWLVEHDAVAWNYRLGAVNAALGCRQLQRFDDILKRKQTLTERYREAFRNIGSVRFLEPKYDDDSVPNNWLNSIIVDAEARDDVFKALHAEGILARALPTPLHLLPMFKDSLKYPGKMIESEMLWKTVICLPSGPGLV